MSSLPVPVVSPPEPPPPQTRVCANCGAPLAGEYCSHCGQRHEPHVHTVTHFAAEAFENITHADSRLWRTLLFLFARPGKLTREFFDGRRASYLPPLRLYIVISVVFFLVGMPAKLSVNSGADGGKLTAAELLEQAREMESPDNGVPESVRKQTAEYLRAEAARVSARDLAAEKPADGSAAAAGTTLGYEVGAPANARGETNNNINLRSSGLNQFCDSFTQDPAAAAGFRRNLIERCQRLAGGQGASLGAVVIHNVPRAMFIFLPLLALVMKLLYWRPKRYYVEHLLFLVHNHAFVFLTATLLILFSWIPYTSALMPWIGTAAGCYMVWYIYRAMRNAYGEGRGLTLAKYFTLGFAYLVMSMVMLSLTIIYSALTF